MSQHQKVMKTLLRKVVWGWLVVVLCVLAPTVHAQTNANQIDPAWSNVGKLPISDEESVSVPYLVSDRNETAYAFYSERVQDQTVIMLNRWTLWTGWQQPNDIILPRRMDIARVKGVVLDNSGFFHLIFYSGNERGADIYYTYAPASVSYQASAWHEPILIGGSAGPPSEAALTQEANGNLVVIYTGQVEGLGVYSVQSADAGRTWSQPVLVDMIIDKNVVPMDYQLTVDDSSTVHAIWSEITGAGKGSAVRYARLADNAWSTPVDMAHWEPDNPPTGITPAIFAYQDTLIATYTDLNQSGGALTHSFRYSQDGGTSWGFAEQPFPKHVGTSGRTVFLVDSRDKLHLFVAHRTYIPQQIFGIWHTTWWGNGWEELTPILSGESTPQRPFDPNSPTVVNVQGNRVLMVWQTDPGLVREGLFFSSRLLDTPALPVEPLPASAITAEADKEGVEAVLMTPTPIPTSSLPPVDSFRTVQPRSDATILVTSIFPAILMLGVVVLVISRRRA
jgi:hypothetical protein